MMDYDLIGRDDLIGRTVIDLEDRWFDTRWQVRKTTKDQPSDQIDPTNLATVKIGKPIFETCPEKRSKYCLYCVLHMF